MACALALGVPCLAAAESASDVAARRERELVDRIAAEESVNGPHSPLLGELFSDLGLLYEDSNLKAPAVTAYEQARGVIRANNGLSSLDEASVLEALIRTQEDLGYVEEPWELEQELVALADAHPSDVRAAAIYRKVGDKRIALLNRYLAGEFPPQLVLGCYYHRLPSGELPVGEKNCMAGSRGSLIRALSQEAWKYYSSAVKALTEHELYSSNELHELETKILRISYARGAYGAGRQSLLRSHYYDVENHESPLKRIDSALKVADWGILETQASGTRTAWKAAVDVYQQVYEYLTSEGVDRSSIDARFSPEIPIVVPAFAPSPLVTERPDASSGYVDVAFSITKYGQGKRIEILDATSDVSREAKKDIISAIFRSAFRPRIVDGELADAARVVVRYYVPRSDESN